MATTDTATTTRKPAPMPQSEAAYDTSAAFSLGTKSGTLATHKHIRYGLNTCVTLDGAVRFLDREIAASDPPSPRIKTQTVTIGDPALRKARGKTRKVGKARKARTSLQQPQPAAAAAAAKPAKPGRKRASTANGQTQQQPAA